MKVKYVIKNMYKGLSFTCSNMKLNHVCYKRLLSKFRWWNKKE